MLPTQNRLKKNYEILRVYKRGSYGGGGPLSVKATANRLPCSRVAIVVGKKVDKRAVVRNRNRRRVAELLRGSWAEVKPGFDIVITVHADLAELTPEALARRIDGALARAGVR